MCVPTCECACVCTLKRSTRAPRQRSAMHLGRRGCMRGACQHAQQRRRAERVLLGSR